MVDTFSLEVIYETEAGVTLVEEYVKRKIIPRKYRDDARHIAVAVVNDVDVIITWNCKHMAQVEKADDQCSQYDAWISTDRYCDSAGGCWLWINGNIGRWNGFIRCEKKIIKKQNKRI